MPEGTIVRTPLRKSVIYSSVHCSLMDKLGAAGSIGGVCDLKYIKLPVIQDGYRNGTVTDCGDGMNPDMERLSTCIPMLFCFLRLRTAVVTDALKTEYSYYRVCRLYGDFRFGACRMDAFLRVAFGVVSKADSLLPRWIVVITSLENVLHFRLRLCLLSVN